MSLVFGTITAPKDKNLIWDASKGRAEKKHLAIGIVLGPERVADVFNENGFYVCVTSGNVLAHRLPSGKLGLCTSSPNGDKHYCAESGKLIAFKRADKSIVTPWWLSRGITSSYAVKSSCANPLHSNAHVDRNTGTNRPAWYGSPTAPGTRFSRLGAGE